jgi:antitoxin component YwqK of YwqJK toxin-antitoxin module
MLRDRIRMRMNVTLILLVLLPFYGLSDNAPSNRIDENQQKQGYWILYAKVVSPVGSVDSVKIEEGRYVNNRKEGKWIKYHEDGKTPKLKGHYVNNRPNGAYEKYYSNGNIRQKGCFVRGNTLDEECIEFNFYESGQIEQKRTVDSAHMYFRSGGLAALTMTDKNDAGKEMTVRYFEVPANMVKDTLYALNGQYTGIVRETVQPDFSIEPIPPSESRSPVKSDEQAPIIRNPRTKGKAFDPNAYNKIYDELVDFGMESTTSMTPTGFS